MIFEVMSHQITNEFADKNTAKQPLRSATKEMGIISVFIATSDCKQLCLVVFVLNALSIFFFFLLLSENRPATHFWVVTNQTKPLF